jgi:hypothetical protein
LKRRNVFVLGALAFAGLLAGCASTPSGEAFSKLIAPRADRALVYLYRPDEYYGKGLAFTVLVDDQEKGNIGNGGYLILPLDARKHTIRVKGLAYKDEPREIDVPAGGMGFLKIVTTKGFGGLSAKLTLEAADQSKATAELAGLKREPERYIDGEI